MERQMDRDVALRVDAMLMGVRASLDHITHYVKNNSSEEEFKMIARHIVSSMTQTVLISNSIHDQYQDIISKELK
jgi:hypothetical protein